MLERPQLGLAVRAGVEVGGLTALRLALTLKEGTATIVYAIGSAEDKNLSLVAQTISGLHSAPGDVPSGDGGAAGTGLQTWWYVLAFFRLREVDRGDTLTATGSDGRERRYRVVARRSTPRRPSRWTGTSPVTAGRG